MRLLFVINGFGSGGAERQMVNLALGLQQRGHQVEFFIYHPQHNHFTRDVEEASIPIHRFYKSWRFSPGVIWALHRQIYSGYYDGILSFLDMPNFYAELARYGQTQPVLVVSQRNTYATQRLPVSTLFLEQFHKLADHITVNSHHQRERMEQQFPWMQGWLTTIYNGIDLQKFSPCCQPKSAQSEPFSLLAIGSIIDRKNTIGLAQALVMYREQYGTPPRVRWAGRRVFSKAGEKTFMETTEFLNRQKLTDCWEWLGERTDIPMLLRENDALIHPSFREGLPNAVCEALASGRPVLASAICDNSRLVQENLTGFLFDPHRPEEIASAIHHLAKLSQKEWSAMGCRARAFAEEQLSNSRFIDEYEQLFCKLIRRRDLRKFDH